MEKQLELEGMDTVREPTTERPWTVDMDVLFVDYVMKRAGDNWYMDEELTLDQLRGFELGDIFQLEAVPNTSEHSKEKFPTKLNLKRIGKSLNWDYTVNAV